MQVVVVESPGKVKSINKYLGPGYKVMASYGHIRDLPSKDGSVKPDEDFAMTWDIDGKSIKHVKEIADAMKEADGLILATDPDREGEAISWHVLEALTNRKVLKGKTIQRVTFNAITKKAVTDAINAPRQIDQQLVDAYLARRALDYLVGFSLSPVLWRKLPGSRSAGRVQSVALRIVVDREIEIERFITQEYWNVTAKLSVSGSEFEARLTELNGKRLQKFDLPNAAMAAAALSAVKSGSYRVASVEAKPVKRNPPPPFTTSTLQQEAARKLGFSASRTMQIAQRLYEGISIGGENTGLITYMRTDGVQMAEEAYAAARSAIGRNYGKEYLPDGPRRYTSKAKNAQEAHEAVRPTDFDRKPGAVSMEPDMARLYELIWKRAVASQMEAASLERTTVEIPSTDNKVVLRATGQVVKFDGFLTLYQEGKDESDDEEGGRLPTLKQGDTPKLNSADHTQSFTEPPPRYSEASLVKRLEELGIGRPSTYASTLSTLIDRDYVRLDQKRFYPEDKGRLVTIFLEKFFARYVEYDFTAGLEEKLDLVSDGKLAWKDLLRDFWKDFSGAIGATAELRVTNVIDALNEVLEPHLFPAKYDDKGNKVDARQCPNCGKGQLSLKLGKFGAFVGCSNYPECRFTRPFGAEQKDGTNDIPPEGKLLGNDPADVGVFLKNGRFGAYVQLGPDPVDKGDKPRRSSIPPGWPIAELSLEQALKLLSLPREVGKHPEDGEPIEANLGRYGPYVKHGKTYANVPDVNELFEIGLNRAVTLIAEKRAGKGAGRGRNTIAPLKELGNHPDGEPINLFNGRFGPYLKHGTINANIPRGADPASITLEQAIELVDTRAAAAPSTKMKGRKKAAKPAAKKAEAKPTGDSKINDQETGRQGSRKNRQARRQEGARQRQDEGNSGRGMSRPPRSKDPQPEGPPTRELVLDYLEKNPSHGAKRDIARGLNVAVEHKPELRRILNELEAEGALVRTAKRAFQPAEAPPPTGVVKFERIDRDGDLIGRAVGRDGPYGPDIVYSGGAGHRKGQGRDVAVGVGDRALARVSKGAEGVWHAKVIKKLDSTPETTLIGVYRANKFGGIVEPTSRKEKNNYIVEKSDSRNAADGDLVRINARPAKGYGPRRANVLEVIGRADDPRAASIIAMHTHGVPDEFPEQVIEEANKAKPAPAPREDLTRIPLVTIDPEDARDHDDAVYAEPDGHGGWRVIVAIADVSAYVRTGTALDREAYRRGNSTYFPDRVSPMLPEHLSADLCSLKEGELRETFAVEMFFNSSGAKTRHRFIRGKMRSAAKLSYRQAQDAVDGRPDAKTQPLLESVLKPLWDSYWCVDKARKNRHPLDLDLPERRVRIGEDGKIASISLRERFDAHRLIEEFMIQANVCAAETLEDKRSALVYRIHDQPSEEKINSLGNFLPTIGLKWTRGETVTGARFNKLLADVKGSENEALVNEMVLRTQAQARYSSENLGHFGLNLTKYAHFTSPIRRYSDLIVHRGLIRALGLGPDGMTDQDIVRLEEQAEHVTMTERRSMSAEREATDRYLAIFMADRVGAIFDARIAGVTRSGLFVRIKENGADGFIPAARLSDEYWIYDEAHAALVAQRSGQRYEMGMDVQVKLMEATPLTGGLLFSMQSPPRARRNDLKAPEREQRSNFRSDRGSPARKRPTDGGGRPPGVRHSTQKGPGGGGKGKASYGKNKKRKGR